MIRCSVSPDFPVSEAWICCAEDVLCWQRVQALFGARGVASCDIDTSQPVGTVIQASMLVCVFACTRVCARMRARARVCVCEIAHARGGVHACVCVCMLVFSKREPSICNCTHEHMRAARAPSLSSRRCRLWCGAPTSRP